MILNIIRKEILLVLKEKGTFFWLFLLPILFIVMFSSIFGNQRDTFTINYYDEDGTKASQQLVDTLKSIKGFDLKTDTATALDAQLQKIKDGKATSLLIIPKGYETQLTSGKSPASLDFYRDATADTAVAPIKALLGNVTSEFRDVRLKAALQQSGKSEAEAAGLMTAPVKVNEVKENASRLDAITQVVPGYTVMFVFFIMITIIRNFLKDKESGMLSRLRSTPMKPLQYLIGMWVPNILVVVVQSATLLVFGKLVYGLHIGDALSIALIVLCLAVCATGLGLMLALLVRSENQGVAFVQLITMGGAVVGGLWFPYDFLPSFAQTIGRFTPQYWALHSLQDVMIRGANIGDIWLTLIVLLGFGLIGLAVASLRYKRFLNAAVN